MSAKATHPSHPVLSIINNQVTTTSRDVARYFERDHRSVLKAIQNIDCPDEFGQRNFALSNYLTQQGKEQPMYRITRDGFTILAMGFTGPKAMKFKLAYIEAFNAMEAELIRQQQEKRLLPAVTDTELLKCVLSLQNGLVGIHEKLNILSSVASYLEEMHSDFGKLAEYAERLTRIADIENSIHSHYHQLRAAIDKLHGQGEIRRRVDEAGDAVLAQRLGRVEESIKRIEMRLDAEDKCRKGLSGYLEAHLPRSEADDTITTLHMSRENDPEKFLRECFALDPWAVADLAFIYKLYKAWCLQHFTQPLGRVNFAEHLKEHLPDNVLLDTRKSKTVLIGIKPVSEKILTPT
jgi:Rha family phage regulatory protein